MLSSVHTYIYFYFSKLTSDKLDSSLQCFQDPVNPKIPEAASLNFEMNTTPLISTLSFKLHIKLDDEPHTVQDIQVIISQRYLHMLTLV